MNFIFKEPSWLLLAAAAVSLLTSLRERLRGNEGLMNFFLLIAVPMVFCAVVIARVTADNANQRHQDQARAAAIARDVRPYCAKHHCRLISVDPESLTARVKLSAGCKVDAYVYGIGSKWVLNLPGPTGECLPRFP